MQKFPYTHVTQGEAFGIRPPHVGAAESESNPHPCKQDLHEIVISKLGEVGQAAVCNYLERLHPATLRLQQPCHDVH